MPYRSLDADMIEQTLQRLHARIEERFPGRGIAQVCAELVVIAGEDKQRAKVLARSNPWLRLAVAALLVAGAGVIWRMSVNVRIKTFDPEAMTLVQGVDATLNIVALVGAGVWFLLNLESRLKRGRILDDLHELRSIAHVIDMHQLTKDPTTLMAARNLATASSPVRDMTEFELTRYLEYCSEMLSLTGKLAALYMQNVRDDVVISAVNDIEQLTGNLSRKVWQKIMILRQLDEGRPPAAAPDADR